MNLQKSCFIFDNIFRKANFWEQEVKQADWYFTFDKDIYLFMFICSKFFEAGQFINVVLSDPFHQKNWYFKRRNIFLGFVSQILTSSPYLICICFQGVLLDIKHILRSKLGLSKW